MNHRKTWELKYIASHTCNILVMAVDSTYMKNTVLAPD